MKKKHALIIKQLRYLIRDDTRQDERDDIDLSVDHLTDKIDRTC